MWQGGKSTGLQLVKTETKGCLEFIQSFSDIRSRAIKYEKNTVKKGDLKTMSLTIVSNESKTSR